MARTKSETEMNLSRFFMWFGAVVGFLAILTILALVSFLVNKQGECNAPSCPPILPSTLENTENALVVASPNAVVMEMLGDPITDCIGFCARETCYNTNEDPCPGVCTEGYQACVSQCVTCLFNPSAPQTGCIDCSTFGFTPFLVPEK